MPRSSTSTASKRRRSTVRTLHRQGRKAICYLDVGSWESYRPDAGQFPRSVIGNRYEGFPDERWLDIRRFQLLRRAAASAGSRCAPARASTRSSPTTSPAGKTRPAFRSPRADQLRFNRWIARQVHARGMAVALKNDGGQVEQLVGSFDFAIVEQCFQYEECGLYKPFVEARQGGLRGRVRTRPGRSSAPPPRRSASARSASPTTSSPAPGSRASRLLRLGRLISGRARTRKPAKETRWDSTSTTSHPRSCRRETRTFARLCASLTEEAEAIGWYEQRLAVEADAEAQGDHARRPGGGVQALRDGPRVPPAPQPALAADREGVLFQDGDIVEHGEAAEAGSAEGDGGDDATRSGRRLARNRQPQGGGTMNHLLRQLAPISDAGWELLDDEARERLQRLAGGAPAGRLRRPPRLAALGDQPRPRRGGRLAGRRRRHRRAAPRPAAGRAAGRVHGLAGRAGATTTAAPSTPTSRRSTRPRSGSRSPRTSPSSTAGPRPASPASPRPRRSRRSRSATAPRTTRARSPARSRRCARSASKGPTASRSAPTSTRG